MPPVGAPYRRRPRRSTSFTAPATGASVSVKVGSFVKSTAAAPVLQTVTGLGFVPKAILFWTSGGTADGTLQTQATAAARACLGIAAGTGPNEQFAAATVARPTGTTGRRATQKAILFINNSVVLAEASLVSFDYDSFTLNWTTNNAETQIVHYLAIGGADVLAKVQGFAAPAATGNFSVTGVGFQPNLLLNVGSITFPTTFDTIVGGIGLRLGAATGPSSRWSLSCLTIGGAGSAAWRWHRADRFVCQTSSGGPPPSAEMDLVSLDPDGYTLSNLSTFSLGALMGVLALKVPKVALGTMTKPTGATPATRKVSGLGFTPSAVLLVGDQDVNRGNAASQGGARVGISAITASGTEASIFSVPNAPGTVSYGYEEKAGSAALKIDNSTPAIDAEASTGRIDTDGFTTIWSPNDAVATEIAYIAFGPTAAAFSRGSIELEAQLTPGVWTSLTADLMQLSVSYGISGAGPLDLVASSGQLSFVLDNGESNSAQKIGYYSPESSNVRPGFILGVPVRVRVQQSGVIYSKFYGWIDVIDAEAGRYGPRITACTAADWMDQAAQNKPTGVATQVGLRSDQVAAAVLAAVPRQPLGGTSFQAGDSTFPYALDNSKSEDQPVITEIQRITQSEFGRAYMTGDGVFHWEKRTTRLVPTVVASFDDTMVRLSAPHKRSGIVNRVKTTLHPRRVDGTTGTVLFSNQGAPGPIAAAATITIIGRYNDPNNRAIRVGGKDFNAPVATTDYLMNAASDGSGTDLTANFSVSAVYGANQVTYTITNNGATPGFVTKLQARGRGLYDYDPVDTEQTDQVSIASFGDTPLAIDLAYQADSTVAAAIASYVVGTLAQPKALELVMDVYAVTDAQKSTLLGLEPGSAISVRETVTGVTSTFWVHQVSLQFDTTGRSISGELLLQRAQIQSYWTLGIAGFSELGATTVLAPL